MVKLLRDIAVACIATVALTFASFKVALAEEEAYSFSVDMLIESKVYPGYYKGMVQCFDRTYQGWIYYADGKKRPKGDIVVAYLSGNRVLKASNNCVLFYALK